MVRVRATNHVARYANACVWSTSWPLQGAVVVLLLGRCCWGWGQGACARYANACVRSTSWPLQGAVVVLLLGRCCCVWGQGACDEPRGSVRQRVCSVHVLASTGCCCGAPAGALLLGLGTRVFGPRPGLYRVLLLCCCWGVAGALHAAADVVINCPRACNQIFFPQALLSK